MELENDAEPVVSPEKVLSWRLKHTGGQQGREWLIKWQEMDIADATWEDEIMLNSQFPSFCLEDKANFDWGVMIGMRCYYKNIGPLYGGCTRGRIRGRLRLIPRGKGNLLCLL